MPHHNAFGPSVQLLTGPCRTRLLADEGQLAIDISHLVLDDHGVQMKFIYAGIRVRDMDESISFYTQVMGMRLLDRAKIITTKGEVASLQSPGSDQVLELNCHGVDSEFSSPYEVAEGLDHLAFKVEDVKGAVEDLRSGGAEIALEPFVEEGADGTTVILAFVKDPNGIWIELYK